MVAPTLIPLGVSSSSSSSSGASGKGLSCPCGGPSCPSVGPGGGTGPELPLGTRKGRFSVVVAIIESLSFRSFSRNFLF